LKPEQWGSTLVQEMYQEEKACDKRHPYLIIITIINRFNTETNDISTMNSNNRIAATLYSLGT